MMECTLCRQAARMYCESDRASLCWDCDAKVHGANFLVARHTRCLLCRTCQAPTPWKASGSRLGPTVSVCDKCAGGGFKEPEEERRHSGEPEEEMDVETESEEEEEDDDDDDDEEAEEEEEEEEDGENQVVPLSNAAEEEEEEEAQPPPVASSSSSDESTASASSLSSGRGFRKRKRVDYADEGASQERDGACSPASYPRYAENEATSRWAGAPRGLPIRRSGSSGNS